MLHAVGYEPPTRLLTTGFFTVDGQKMSKSYNNTIELTEAPESVIAKIKKMPTDPARVKRSDPGDPDKCPVWSLHKIYSSDEVKKWADKGCRTAGIGCLDCKAPLIDSIIAEQKPIIERYNDLQSNPGYVETVIQEATARSREVARETLDEVSTALGIK